MSILVCDCVGTSPGEGLCRRPRLTSRGARLRVLWRALCGLAYFFNGENDSLQGIGRN